MALLTTLREYQESDAQIIAKIVQAKSEKQLGEILAYEQGLGKTVTTLRTIELIKPRRVLILCPAAARMEWRRQIHYHYESGDWNYSVCKSGKDIIKWNAGERPGVKYVAAPEPKRPQLSLVPDLPASKFGFALPSARQVAAVAGREFNKHLGPEKPESQTEILITGYSPSLLSKLDDKARFDLVVLDECQEVSNPLVKTSVIVDEIIAKSDAFVLSLSGTPALDRPEQIWHVASLAQPMEWGSFNDFRYRFLQRVENEFAPSGFYLKGLKPERRAELSSRLSKIMIRRTKQEVAADLPPMIVSLRYVPAPKEDFDWNAIEEGNYAQFAESNRSAKIEETIALLESARADGERKFTVFSYLNLTGQILTERLQALGYNVVNLEGVAPDSRQRRIDEVANSEVASVLVCTIDSVGVALDFTWCQTAVFAEQHWRPGKTSQASQRFHRLSSKHSVKLWFIVAEGTQEERKAEVYLAKQKDLSIVQRQGEFEDRATEELDLSKYDPEGLEDLL